MPSERILILGGTGQAVDIAERLSSMGFEVISSIAGVTREPVTPRGIVRRGGFGGSDGLTAFLKTERIAALVDATHPYALQISKNAAEAAPRAGIPLLRLERPEWISSPRDHWIDVDTISDAVKALPAGAKAFVTVGRKEIAPFFEREDISGVARMIEKPGLDVPPNWRLILARPPFTFDQEKEVMVAHKITHIVSKNAGGEQTEAKLDAARDLGLPVIMVRRPLKPPATSATSVAELCVVLARLVSP